MKAKTILAAIMLVAFSVSLSAQSEKAKEKYEYGEIAFSTASNAIIVVTQQGRQEFKLEKNEVPQVAVIKKVDELAASGWEVYNVSECPSIGNMNPAYFVRRIVKPEVAEKPRTTTWR